MNAQRSVSIFVQPDSTSLALPLLAAVRQLCGRSQTAHRSQSQPVARKAQGKIKGRGTCARRKPGLHVGWRGTRLRGGCAVSHTKVPSCLGFSRASHAILRDNTLELIR
jgi:hypothetical protein